MDHEAFKEKLNKFCSQRNIGIKCKVCTKNSKNICNCTWSHGPDIKSIYLFFKKIYSFDTIIKSKSNTLINIFTKLYAGHCDDNSNSYIWSQNLYLFIFQSENLAIICDKHITKNIALFNNLLSNTFGHKKMFNFKYFDYNLNCWFTSCNIYIFDEESSVNMLCFNEREYEQTEHEGVKISKLWYRNTLVEEINMAINR